MDSYEMISIGRPAGRSIIDGYVMHAYIRMSHAYIRPHNNKQYSILFNFRLVRFSSSIDRYTLINKLNIIMWI
jgi:hypothetical protein